MFYLKIKIMLFGVRAKPDLLDNDLLGLGLYLLLLLLLLVLKFRIVNNLADRRISTRRDFHEIQTLIMSKLDCLLNRVYITFDIFANDPYALRSNALIYFVRLFGSLWAPSEGPVKTRSAASGIDTL